jgi:hypothetical protein
MQEAVAFDIRQSLTAEDDDEDDYENENGATFSGLALRKRVPVECG